MNTGFAIDGRRSGAGFFMRGGFLMNVPTVTANCETCRKRTPHRTTPVSAMDFEPDGRQFQTMACALCGAFTKVYFTPGTNEFQENLDYEVDSDNAQEDVDSASAESNGPK